MEVKAIVEINLLMRDGETFEEASDRLYNLLYEGVCCNADATCDFWIQNVEEN